MNRLILILLFGIFACNSTDTNIKEHSIGKNDSFLPIGKRNDKTSISKSVLLANRKRTNELIDLAINNGDTLAYYNVSGDYMIGGGREEFLYYALIMANRYNFAQAYFDVYKILSTPRSGERFETLDKRTRNMAMYYLLKSYEGGSRNGYYEVDEMFSGKVIPKSSLYKSLY